MILNEPEQRICRFIARVRNEYAIKNGIINQQVDDSRTSEEINLDGFGAEMAFAKMVNLYPDFGKGVIAGSSDLIAKNGKTIDVKSSKYSPTWLTCKKSKNLGDSFYYVMLTGIFPEYKLAGWATENELLLPENLKDWGYGPDKEMYSLAPQGIKGLEEFLQEIE